MHPKEYRVHPIVIPIVLIVFPLLFSLDGTTESVNEFHDASLGALLRPLLDGVWQIGIGLESTVECARRTLHASIVHVALELAPVVSEFIVLHTDAEDGGQRTVAPDVLPTLLDGCNYLFRRYRLPQRHLTSTLIDVECLHVALDYLAVLRVLSMLLLLEILQQHITVLVDELLRTTCLAQHSRHLIPLCCCPYVVGQQ